jgi:hypothetical protein
MVMPAHLARLDARFDDMERSMVPTTSFVVVARTSGVTTVHVRSDDGDRTLAVTVLPGATPIAATPATAAAR